MTKARIALAIMSILSLLFGGCGKQSKIQQNQSQVEPDSLTQLDTPPEVTSESEEDFHDLVFYIKDYKKLADGTQIVRALGIHNGQQIGLDVVLGVNWKTGSLGKGVPLVTYQGIVTYRSIGAETDSFLKVVDELYGTKLNPKMMKGEIAFTGITLGGDPRDIAREPVQIKLFYESGGDEAYAELYTNIEIAKHKLEIKEKDPDYRKLIVRALESH
jgi:hypothetical protein